MIYGYARVSTLGQAKDGNSLEAQEKLLKDNGASVVYLDHYTGTKEHRPEWDKLMAQLKKSDTLLVAKIDRLTRNLQKGVKLVEDLLEQGVKVNILNLGVIDNTPTGRLIMQIMMAFAEFERNMIVERTTEGKRIAKQNNPDFKEGRPRHSIKGVDEMYKRVLSGELTVVQAASELKVAPATLYHRFNELGFVIAKNERKVLNYI